MKLVSGRLSKTLLSERRQGEMSVGKGKEQRENLDGGGQGTRAIPPPDHV